MQKSSYTLIYLCICVCVCVLYFYCAPEWILCIECTQANRPRHLTSVVPIPSPLVQSHQPSSHMHSHSYHPPLKPPLFVPLPFGFVFLVVVVVCVRPGVYTPHLCWASPCLACCLWSSPDLEEGAGEAEASAVSLVLFSLPLVSIARSVPLCVSLHWTLK